MKNDEYKEIKTYEEMTKEEKKEIDEIKEDHGEELSIEEKIKIASQFSSRIDEKKFQLIVFLFGLTIFLIAFGLFEYFGIVRDYNNGDLVLTKGSIIFNVLFIGIFFIGAIISLTFGIKNLMEYRKKEKNKKMTASEEKEKRNIYEYKCLAIIRFIILCFMMVSIFTEHLIITLLLALLYFLIPKIRKLLKKEVNDN